MIDTTHDSQPAAASDYAALEKRVARALLKARAASWAGRHDLAAYYEERARRYVAAYRGALNPGSP